MGLGSNSKIKLFYKKDDLKGFVEAGGSVSAWQDHYLELKGILPSSTKSFSDPNSILEKSIFRQYSSRIFVDVFGRARFLWNLPGHGVAYPTVYDDGELVRAGCGFVWADEGLGCLNIGDHPANKVFIQLKANTCLRAECPICYEKWAVNEAHRIEDRFRRVPKHLEVSQFCAEVRSRISVKGPDGKKMPGRPIHLMLSVPEAEAIKNGRPLLENLDNYKEIRSKASEIAKKIGFKGGCMIFHPFSNSKLSEEADARIEVDPDSGDFDPEAVKDFFQQQNRAVKFWFWRPHFHLIGYCDWVDSDKVESLNDETGWVIRNLGVRRSVLSTAFYQLSHAGVKPDTHTVSWIGKMSNRLFNELDPVELPDRIPECPVCGKALQPIHWAGGGPSPLNGRPENPKDLYGSDYKWRGYWIDPGSVLEGDYQLEDGSWCYRIESLDWLPGGYTGENLRPRLVRPIEDDSGDSWLDDGLIFFNYAVIFGLPEADPVVPLDEWSESQILDEGLNPSKYL